MNTTKTTAKTTNTTKAIAMAHGLLAAAMIAALPAVAGAEARDFVVLDNAGDQNFNQLLGINDSRIIVGYFGDGTLVPNNGYLLVPRNHYSVENFTALPSGDSATETQAIGINNDAREPRIVGFYTDAVSGVTHGFLDSDGTQVTVDDPQGSAPNVSAPVQNLLGVNDKGQAAGFWTAGDGTLHGFVVKFDASAKAFRFTEISPSSFKGAVSTQASNITNDHLVCGFWSDKNKVSHGFYGELGDHYHTFDVEIGGMKASSTQAFGCNDNGEIVGQFADSTGNLHGFVYRNRRFERIDAPGSSQVAVLGVQGTLVNGVNDLGDIVGFYSDGTSKVNGFVKYSED
jgi:probable HAF family extracellular repeat protein